MMTRSSPFSFAQAPVSPRVHLHEIMGGVLEAEAALTRERYRAAAAKAGLDHRGIFESCDFVSRTSADRWSEAFEEGRLAAKPDDVDKDEDPLEQPADPSQDDPEGPEERPRKKKKKTDDDEFDEPVDAGKHAAYWSHVRATVRGILDAHAVATGRTPSTPARK